MDERIDHGWPTLQSRHSIISHLAHVVVGSSVYTTLPRRKSTILLTSRKDRGPGVDGVVRRRIDQCRGGGRRLGLVLDHGGCIQRSHVAVLAVSLFAAVAVGDTSHSIFQHAAFA